MTPIIIVGIIILIAVVVVHTLAKEHLSEDDTWNASSSIKHESTYDVTITREKTLGDYYRDHHGWLAERWEIALALKGLDDSGFPKWYYRKATEAQLDWLRGDGIEIPDGFLRGQASDIIGLKHDPEQNDIDTLTQLGKSSQGLNQTQAKEEIRKLLLDPSRKAELEAKREEVRAAAAKREAEKRAGPPTAGQKEMLRFIGRKVPKAMTYAEAEKESKKAYKDPDLKQKIAEWNLYEETVDEFSDPDVRAEHEIKKPSKSRIKAALAALREEGEEIESFVDAEYEIADKLKEMYPDLERE